MLVMGTVAYGSLSGMGYEVVVIRKAQSAPERSVPIAQSEARP